MSLHKILGGLLLCLACGAASADSVATGEDFLKAPDRIQFQAGALYDGRFDDGTHFQIQLAYPRPASVPKEALQFDEYYWYPKRFTGQVLALMNTGHTPGTLRLSVRPEQGKPAAEDFTIALAPDRLSGRGTWTSSTLHKQMTFTLQRALVYDAVAVQRPAPPEALENDPGRKFTFSAWFPVLGVPDADAWVRKQAGSCAGDLECMNRIEVRWKSPSLLSLDASIWQYDGGAHGIGGSTTRQYVVDKGRWVPVGIDAFVDPGQACVSKVTAAIVAQLHAQKLQWTDDWSKNAPLKNKSLKFMPTTSGIEFSFDPYEVGSYAQGSPSVFLTRAQLGTCLRQLPAAD